MSKRILIILLLLALSMILIACGKERADASVESMTYDEILKESEGTTVSFYGWGGDENINSWLDNTVAKVLKEKYDITLNRVPMLPNEYLPKLLNEKLAKEEGTIDIVWINGENFATAKNENLLFGPFTSKLPNYNKYIDTDSNDVKYDFGNAIDGFEAPYGKAQMVFITDSEKVDNYPAGHEELLELAKTMPGKITYPEPTDFTGSAFVRNIIYDVVGFDAFIDVEADKETVRKVIAPAIEYFKELKPYLWREGMEYPATIAQLDNMYADGEVIMTMNYTPFHIATKIEEGTFPDTSISFVFEKGSIGNTHFLAIPFNSINKEGAMVVINEILTPFLQSGKFDPNVWGDLPVTDPEKLNAQEQAMYDSIMLGKGVLSQEELLTKRVPEMKADIVPIIEEIWREELLNE